MLNPEVAEEQIEQWRVDPEVGQNQVFAKIRKLPIQLRTIAFAMKHRKPNGEQYLYNDEERFTTLIKDRSAFHALKKADKNIIVKTLCGKLTDAVSVTVEFAKTLPYQDSWQRKSFRAPGHATATDDRQLSIIIMFSDFTEGFSDDALKPELLAAWVPYLAPYRLDEFGRMLAALIDKGGKTGKEIFDILCQSVTNDHEVGMMGRHVSRALLTSANPAGWDLMERTLLAAQRQEGLRQVILETVDEAHPDAFKRMMQLIVDQKLARFSSVARAVDVWFGLQWDSASVKVLNDTVAQAIELLDDSKKQTEALSGDDPELAFLALWTLAIKDVGKSIPQAAKLIKHEQPEMRFVALTHLNQVDLFDAQPHIQSLLDDEDLRVAVSAMRAVTVDPRTTKKQQEKLFHQLETLLDRLPAKPQKLKSIVWEWTASDMSQRMAAGKLVECLGDLPPTILIPHFDQFDPYERYRVVDKLVQQKKWDQLTRSTLFQIVGDSAADVRAAAIMALKTKKVQPEEALLLEGYLTRKAVDLRQGVVELLQLQSDSAAMESVERLTSSGKGNQRLAGLELLRQMAEAERQQPQCMELAKQYKETRKKLSIDELVQVDGILASDEEEITLANGLGLLDVSGMTQPTRPPKHKVQVVTPAARKLIEELDKLVHKHRSDEVTYLDWQDDEQTELLGNLSRYGFRSPNVHEPVKKQLKRFMLKKVWVDWNKKRSKATRDNDGCEILRAMHWLELCEGWSWTYEKKWYQLPARKELHAMFAHELPELNYPSIVKSVLKWLLGMNPPKEGTELSIAICETAAALIPESDIQSLIPPKNNPAFELEDDWRGKGCLTEWDTYYYGLEPRTKTAKKALMARRWNLQCWLDRPVLGAIRNRPDLYELNPAYDLGLATLDDVSDHLIGPRTQGRYHYQASFQALNTLSDPRKDKAENEFLNRHPEVQEKIDAVRDRILEIELARGEAETPATDPALSLRSVYGINRLLEFLTALGKENYKVASYYSYGNRPSKALTMTHLVQVCYPHETESHADFKKLIQAAVKKGQFAEDKILQLGFLAPQWSGFVEAYYGWDGFSEGLYWFLAHMNSWGKTEEAAVAADYSDDEENGNDEDEDRPKLSAWERLILERTPISLEERGEGAVDVDWFHRTFKLLGLKKWQQMADAARFAANSAQAKKAKLIADVLLGKTSKTELVKGIKERNLKENVRMLGLLPLAKGTKAAKDLQNRYEVLQEYRRYANNLSSLSKPDALRACEIGMNNLARLAGYRDPMRLEWEMEAESTKDLLAGPVVVSKGDVSLTLNLDERSKPELTIQRGGKTIKSLPAKFKKEKEFIELRERSKGLKRQASRVKQSLEIAMCRGDSFSGGELAQLGKHALLAPLLERLVLIGDGVIGYADKKGKALRDYSGNVVTVKKNDQLRIAHPSDLLKTKNWDKWQRECFQAERLQPFKQVFRELYVVTKQEKSDGTFSSRYAGHQVNPKQANALWNARNWNVEDGVWKMFHDVGIIANVEMDYGVGTPLDVEGLQLAKVSFRERDSFKNLKLTAVPDRIFSEVMRDLDLVVSVAHRGEVDPEASASTVEMRTKLLVGTCQLLGIKNVKLKKTHAVIKGHLSDYNVHLGSAVVHKQPGGAICMVPVHAQHRGRLFLPFADDDPKTAEVISKVLLLANDQEIQDPTILEQLMS